jgi:hypothetical protein
MSTSHQYFNIFDFIKTVKNLDVASQIAQSVAFRIDINIQSAARALFKFVRDDQHEKLKTQHIDNLAELTASLGEAAFAERSFHDAGMDRAGPVELIKDLMAIRQEAHDIAADLTALCLDWQGNPRQYAIPDLDDRFYEPVKLRVGEVEKRRAEQGAARRAQAYGLSNEESKALLDKKMARKESGLRDTEQVLTNQAHIVHTFFNLACSTDIDGFSPITDVHNLDLGQQRQLIDSAIKAAERAEEFAERDRNLSDTEYDDRCITVMRVVKDLGDVLKSPRFRVAQFQQDAAAANVG